MKFTFTVELEEEFQAAVFELLKDAITALFNKQPERPLESWLEERSKKHGKGHK